MADPIIANTIRINAVLQNANGLAEDRYLSSFVFTGPGSSSATAALAEPLVRAFIQETAVWLGPQCSRAANASKTIWYDLGEPPVRTPHEATFSLAAAGGGTGSGQPLPAEVACVLSLRSTENDARARGRLYIGPLHQACADTGTANDSRPILGFRTALKGAAERLADNAVLAGISWQILSRSDGDTKEVVGGFIDDAWDTQRRRGVTPTSRLGWLRGA